MKQKRIKVEITNMINGCLEQGGVCGRVVSYPLYLVAEIIGDMYPEDLLDMHPEDLANMEVPGTDCRLADYLAYHHGDQCHVVRKGTKIQ